MQRYLGTTFQISTAEELTDLATSGDTVTAAEELPITDLEDPTFTSKEGGRQELIATAEEPMATSSPDDPKEPATEEATITIAESIEDSGRPTKTVEESLTDNNGVTTLTSISWIAITDASPTLTLTLTSWVDVSPTPTTEANTIELELTDAILGENTMFGQGVGFKAMKVPEHMLLY